MINMQFFEKSLFTSCERVFSRTRDMFDKKHYPSKIGEYFLSYNQLVMGNSVPPVVGKGGEKLDRRSFIKNTGLGLGALAVTTVGGIAGTARQVLAGEIEATPVVAEKEATFEYVESQLGIDYRSMAPNPLDAILSQGEAEWMKNAKVDYEEDTAEAWSDDLAPEIATGAISEATIENLREFTPEMLTKFAAGLDPQDPKYGGLWSVGNLFIAEKIGGKA